MITAANGEWITDTVNMTCRNTTNNIVVVFEKFESNLVGKIKNIPLELVKKWTAEKRGDRNIRNTVMEAEEIFLKAYSESMVK
ncbi:MAG: hypothetical protein LBH43_06985 [Treponema sp.]|jgi:hypothetical protein|nr:hypothetical protein [Treponema sp.]